MKSPKAGKKAGIPRLGLRREAGLAALALAAIGSVGYLLWAAPGDNVKVEHQPAVFSKTDIIGGETFHVALKSKATVIADLPRPIKAEVHTFRYLAKNKATGETTVLNPGYTVRIEPFPLKTGETYETSKNVPLVFATGTKEGDYAIIEELASAESIKPDAPTQPTAPTQPSAPTQPTAPSKPPEPSQPTAPTQPSAPSGPDGGGGAPPPQPTEPSKPPEPEKPPEPSQPPAPTQPAEPPKPAEPSGPTEPFVAPPPRILGTVRYSPEMREAMPKPLELTVAPPTVVNAQKAVGLIKLGKPASSKSQIVYLSAYPGNSAAVPSSLTLKPGATTGSFDILTKRMTLPAKPVTLTIKARITGAESTATLVITPPHMVSSLVVAPSAVTNGEVSVGKVVLNTTSTQGGIRVFLSASPGNLVSMPATLVIKEGQISGSFDIKTKAVNAASNVTISATLDRVRIQRAVLRINPTPKTSSVSVRPPWVIAGSVATGTVLLTAPAGSGGQSVALTVTPSGAAVAPRGIVIPAGQSAGTFAIQTKPVTGNTNVTVAATANNVRKTTVFTVAPLVVSAFKVSPASAMNGATSTGTVTLNGPAPEGGQSVTLSASPASYVEMPTSVLVKAGEKAASFPIQAKTPPLPEEVTIAAMLNGSRLVSKLTVGSTTKPSRCPYTCREGYLSGKTWGGRAIWGTKCEANEIAETRVACPSVKKSYSCGTWGLSTCWDDVPSVCCKPKP